ncbi:cupin-like domain-containing protein [Aurantiacibacter zhengii]|uniref:Cupin-like domain-containing protein n=1 Tax=Aurantiacibacter zhengii TaxID=2307003 RepID=A0A418NTA8_9SPHN|nr:cupin-like domain-containing protein [Aurantiacibacter zhengii]RIV86734.1 cupin-like domain-containing protein [Aurantiacibacter zhengii]
MKPIREISLPSGEVFERDIRTAYEPVVIRGAVADWPLVKRGRNAPSEALTYLERLDTGAPTELMIAPSSEGGRFFYSPDMRGFNFRRERATLSQLTQHLRQIEQEAEPIGIYAGATPAASHLPGFERENAFPLGEGQSGSTTRVWVGNATQVATHFDLSDNFAVVAVGTRRFTLFPPEATANLYVGPLDMTLAGQPVSMVDPLSPDLDRYPRYEDAAELAQFAELEPGDAIYIPTLWWHHVQATQPINVLVNYWHNDAQRGGGFLALVHAILAIRDQPAGERRAWQSWFDHFVFSDEAADAAAHLPPPARTVTGPPSPQRDEMIRRFILQVMSGR